MAEIALVVVLFGLIVAGALKGCEMMARAGIISTVKQIEKIDSALRRFDEDYKFFPGDIADAPKRISGCDAACRPDTGIKANRIIDSSPEDRQRPGMESVVFWRQLYHSASLDFVNKDLDNPDRISVGDGVPRASIGGALVVGFHKAKQDLVNVVSGDAPRGHYLTISADPDKSLGTNDNWPSNAQEIFAIDSKLDDGKPNKGELLAGGMESCVDTSGDKVTYAVSGQAGCTLFYRLAK